MTVARSRPVLNRVQPLARWTSATLDSCCVGLVAYAVVQVVAWQGFGATIEPVRFALLVPLFALGLAIASAASMLGAAIAGEARLVRPVATGLLGSFAVLLLFFGGLGERWSG